ncbi:hypothetical protein FRX31_006855 [Thalictrum thalictroides]|uniref:Transmembrane protein n=1 Tax=Thalictrum thalictroides TaxID=46969 RepID=A0A7J6X5C6_THATH|nr:hypothetical protein FRX31_006855 [Thalictrum thalictroides]
MEFKTIVLVVLVLVLIATLLLQQYEAARVLEEEDVWMKTGKLLLLSSFQKGSDPHSGPSGCTNLPDMSGPNCPINHGRP